MNRYSNNLHWKCAICESMREDEFISVRRFDISARCKLEWGAAIENIKYCNDNADCVNVSLRASKGVLLDNNKDSK